ncbi:hypothetical protein C1X64_14500 [Pseudomonas sp. GW456-E7]|nr:hypothetical protein C1X64_14500 [Pseudomonas sp. GW456-E7]
MSLVQSRFSSGQHVPLLVQDDQAAPLPKLVPFIYVQLKLKHRAYNTAAANLPSSLSTAVASSSTQTNFSISIAAPYAARHRFSDIALKAL